MNHSAGCEEIRQPLHLCFQDYTIRKKFPKILADDHTHFHF